MFVVASAILCQIDDHVLCDVSNFLLCHRLALLWTFLKLLLSFKPTKDIELLEEIKAAPLESCQSRSFLMTYNIAPTGLRFCLSSLRQRLENGLVIMFRVLGVLMRTRREAKNAFIRHKVKN